MTDREKVKLLFGPYLAPPVKRGDRTTWLYRDSLVVITGWPDAPIPWPRCRPLGSRGGGSGLLLDEELARAVRHESVAAVMFWWGASMTAVCHWRRVLGVTRTDNEGTARLVQVAAERGARTTRGEALPPEQVERRRQTAIEQGLGRNLVLGYHGPRWTEEQLRLLGTAADAEVARRTGRTPNAVRVMRGRLGIPAFAGRRGRGSR
jgi:hypothetical protein